MENNIKPIILVVGVSNSLTSMVAKFLIDCGAYAPDLATERDGDYPRYENRELKKFEDKIQIETPVDVIDFVRYLNSLPTDKTVMLKGSIFIYYWKYFNIDRPIKIVYVLRNPRDVIESNMEKSNRKFIDLFERYCDMYDVICGIDFPVLPFIADGVDIDDCWRLINFCYLTENVIEKEIDIKNILPTIKKRSPTYFQHRFSNFWWKRLHWLFNVKLVKT